MPVAFLLMDDEQPAVRALHPGHVEIGSDVVRSAAAWWALRIPDADDQPFFVGAWRFRTLRGTGEALGLLAMRPTRATPQTRAEQDRWLGALAHQTALAIERCILRERVEASRLRAETERLRSAVLSSISHDLRNPLSVIIGSASSLESQWPSLDDPTRLLLVRSMRQGAERLDGFISKLLDITRIEAGVIAAQTDPVSVSDAVDDVLHQAGRLLTDHRVVIDVPESLPPIEADVILLRQVLYNLVENAAKYSKPGSPIRIVAREDAQAVRISVLDEGGGIPEADIERIFDKFYRAKPTADAPDGTGLGLAICRGFLEAMGGTIQASNRDDRVGAVFAVTLPMTALGEVCEVEP